MKMANSKRTRDVTAREETMRRLLYVGWWAVMTLLPLGHLTGLRNTVTSFVVLATLWWAGRRCWRDLPARWISVALLAWCAASIGWSIVPEVSFAKWRVDLFLPLLAYAAVFGYVMKSGRIDAIVGGTVSGIVCLALLSVPAFLQDTAALQVASVVQTEFFATITNPMPIWFPGVGDASMATALSALGLLFASRLVRGISQRCAQIVAVVSTLSILLILVAINNRNATLTIPVVIVFAVFLDRRQSTSSQPVDSPRHRVRRIVVGVAVIATLVGSVALLESGARQRLQRMGLSVANDESGLVVLTERDTRPMIWSYYTRLAWRHPWIGVGFGRTVPGMTYHTQDDRQLARIEPNAYVHAHNLLLNWWLQTGLVGVSLLLLLLATIVVDAWRARDSSMTRPRAGAVTVIALVVTMLLRDMTDDFLIFGMASMYWILIGAFAAATRTSTDRLALDV